jgi:chaperonin GroES
MKLTTTLLGMLCLEGAHAFSPTKTAFSRSPSYCRATLDGKTIDGELVPLNNMMLIKKVDAIEKTEGGLVLTGKAKVQKTEGTIVAAGPGRANSDSGLMIEMPVEVGESVVYGAFDGTEINYNDKTHILIRDDDVLIKWKGELSLETAGVVKDNVLVHVDIKDEETSSGLLIAKTSIGGSKPTIGTVMKVGPGRNANNGVLMEMDVAEGDMIKFQDFAGNTVDIKGEEYRVVRMNDILAKF